MSSRQKALVGLIVSSLFWSSSGVAAKTLLKSFDPITLGTIRLTLASIMFLPFFLRATPKFSKKLFFDMLPVAIFSAGNFLFFMFGIQKTTANAAGIIYTATPLLVAILSSKFIGEHVSRGKMAGILVGLMGVFVIIVLPILEQAQVIIGDIQGNILIFFAMILFSLFNVSSRHLIAAKSYHPITISGLSIFVSSIMFILLTLFIPHTPIVPGIFVPLNFWMALYFACFVTVVPYILHQWAIKHSSATTGALVAYVQPVFGFVYNGVLLGEVITGGFLVGTLLVFAGSFLATGQGVVRVIRRK